MKTLVILNPNAGHGELGKSVSSIIKALTANGFSSEVLLTTACGDAAEYVKTYGKGRELIICGGGDGTLSETVNGIMAFPESERPLIGYIPCGTTNDFAKSMGIPHAYAGAIANAASGSPVYYDIGSFGKKNFVYVGSFGAFSETSYATPQDLKKVLGHLAYLVEGMKSIPYIKPYHVTAILSDGENIEGDFIFGAVSNSRSLGGVISLESRGVVFDDGLFELTLIKPPKNIADMGQVLYALGSGDYESCELITFRRFSECRILCDEDYPHWSLDGEFEEGGREISIRCNARAVRVVTGGAGKKPVGGSTKAIEAPKGNPGDGQ